MNRASRRRVKPSADRTAWAAGIANVHREAAGYLDVWYVNRADLESLLLAAPLGGAEENALLSAIGQTLRHIKHAPAHLPALCGCCPAEVRGTAFLIVVAAPLGRPLAGSTVLGTTLCQRCQADIATNTLTALRRVWPEAAHLTIHPGSAVVQ